MKLLYLFAVLTLVACNTAPSACVPSATGDIVYVVEHGWHAEIGIPVEELNDPLSFYRGIFPNAKVLMFGYGKKTFWTAPPQTISEYVMGPFPGPAIIQVVGLNVTPVEAYDAGDTVTLSMPPGGSQALSDFIWQDMSKDPDGKPILVAPSINPAGLFYAAQSEYNLMHTCNTWTAEALQHAGLPVSGDAVVFSGQVMSRIDSAAENQCDLVR